jgi:hypothetical protein
MLSCSCVGRYVIAFSASRASVCSQFCLKWRLYFKHLLSSYSSLGVKVMSVLFTTHG